MDRENVYVDWMWVPDRTMIVYRGEYYSNVTYSSTHLAISELYGRARIHKDYLFSSVRVKR